jgi:hypothetical protein
MRFFPWNYFARVTFGGGANSQRSQTASAVRDEAILLSAQSCERW